MSDLISLVGRLRAFQSGRAIRSASHQQVVIQPHSLVICPLALAGEDTTIHALAVGRLGKPAQIGVVPDPRVRDEHYELVTWFGSTLETYFEHCRRVGDFPQVWVSSGAAANHLDILADRLRFTRDNAEIQRVGALLTYLTERSPVAGQQALMTATGALGRHYSTGQQESEDEHLGAFLVWLDPATDGNIQRAVQRAEREVMGVKTDPEFDRTRLQPLVAAYNKARAAGAAAAEIDRRAQAIEAELSPIVERIYDAVQRALGLILGRFPNASILAELAQQEVNAFESFMQARDEGHPLPYRDTPKAAAFKISERELAAQNIERASIYGDVLARERARLAGKVVFGRVTNVTATKVPRRTIFRFNVETTQSNLHLREGDQLVSLSDTRLVCVTEAVRRDGTTASVSFLIVQGMRAVGAPQTGVDIELAPPPPDWNQLLRERSKMSARLAVTPWTHADQLPASQAPATTRRPADLLAAVEAFR